MTSAQFFQIQSTLILLLMLFGVSKSKNRDLHIPIMYTVIILDILLILQIEWNRGAIKKASEAIVNPMLLNIHVSLALFTVIFYMILVYTGKKLQSHQLSFRKKHKIFGYTAITLRILTFITSFFTVTPKQ